MDKKPTGVADTVHDFVLLMTPPNPKPFVYFRSWYHFTTRRYQTV